MGCDTVKPHLRDFLEDLLTESRREEVRFHLATCVPCEEAASRLGSFATDLRRLNKMALTFDLASLIASHLQESAESSSQRRKQAAPFLIPVGIGIVIITMVTFGILQLNKNLKRVPASAPASAPAEMAELPSGGKIAPLPGTVSSETPAVNAESPRPSGGPVIQINLRPLHWHLDFKAPWDVMSFMQKLSALKSKDLNLVFETPHFVVIELNHAALQKLIAVLTELSGFQTKGLIQSLKQLPEFQGTTRVSILARAIEGAKEGPALIHPHFRFSIPNKFQLLEALKEKKFGFLYEAPEVWVLKLASQEEFELYKDEVSFFRGLTGQFDGIEMGKPGETSVTVAIYLDEG